MWKEMRTEKRFARILSYPGIGLGCRHRLRHRSRYCSHRRHRRRCRRHQRQHRRYRSFFPQTKGIGSILDNEEPFHCKNKVDWITLGRQQEANLSQSRLFSVPERGYRWLPNYSFFGARGISVSISGQPVTETSLRRVIF